MTDNTMAKRYQRVIRSSCKQKNNRQSMAKRYQRVIRSPKPNIRMTDNGMAKRYQRVMRSSRKPKNDRQYNGQMIPNGNQK